MIRSFEELRELVRGRRPRRAAVAGAEGEVAVAAMALVSAATGLTGVLVGDPARIPRPEETRRWPIVECPDPAEAARTAVELVRRGEADLVVKGACPTADFMRACLDPERGLRGPGLMAQVFAFVTEHSSGLKLLTDAAVTIRPGVEEKAAMIENAVPLARALGSPRPAVALVCALEKPTARMPDTVEAAEIAAMTGRWQKLGCDVEGPLALDCAVDPEAARAKGLTGPVAGRAELLVFPDLASANIFAKGMACLAGAASGAVVLGGRAPIVMRSRADTVAEKANSILLGLLAADVLY